MFTSAQYRVEIYNIHDVQWGGILSLFNTCQARIKPSSEQHLAIWFQKVFSKEILHILLWQILNLKQIEVGFFGNNQLVLSVMSSQNTYSKAFLQFTKVIYYYNCKMSHNGADLLSKMHQDTSVHAILDTFYTSLDRLEKVSRTGVVAKRSSKMPRFINSMPTILVPNTGLK